jgi:hypothetical protein
LAGLVRSRSPLPAYFFAGLRADLTKQGSSRIFGRALGTLNGMPLLAFILLAQQAVPAQPNLPQHKDPVYVGDSHAVVNAMEAAFGKLDDCIVTIRSDEGNTTIDLLGKRVREEQPSLVWAFDGKTIYLRDRMKHIFVSGKILRHRAVEVVSKVTGRRVDVVTRALLYRRTPLEEAFIDSTVRIQGFVEPNGVPCDILESESHIAKTTIFVRRSDHLPQSVSTATIIDGKTVSVTDRTFTYEKLKVPRFVLARAPNEKVAPFPVLKPEKI